jgi:bifunctional non-homologous end joining protein LigD
VTQLPMLAIASTGASGRPALDVRKLVEGGGWVLDTKLDGIRAFWHEGRLINRQGVNITAKFPEVVAALPEGLWLDGEVVALDGRFETVAARDKQERAVAIQRGVNQHPCTFVAFDIPQHAFMAWDERREQLEHHAQGEGFKVTPVSYESSFVDRVAALGMEGVIAKRLGSRYRFGKRSADWVKSKNVQRITCLVRGYQPGSGSRQHFGNMQLVLVDGDRLVDIGSVGSGFTERETYMLKARLDAGDLLVVEIECLNVTSGNQLRFPVYKGIRTDVQPHDCTIAQLDTLPRC